MMPLVAELTAPALFVAGATTSLHCTMMCGALNLAQLRSHGPVPQRHALALVHGGRVLGYALLGLLAGTLGARLAFWLPDTGGGRALQALAALALVAAGLQQWLGSKRVGGKRVRSIFPAHAGPCLGGRQKIDLTLFPLFPPRARLFAQGLLWALMPCGILYTVVLLAAATASPAAGFVLLAAFGLGTVPLLGASGGLLGLATRPRSAARLRHAAGATLVALGGAGVLLAVLAPEALAGVLCAR